MLMAVNREGVMAIIDDMDQKHLEAHKRLRKEYEDIEAKMAEGFKTLSDGQMLNRARIAEQEQAIKALASTPIDATKLVMTPKIVASIVFVVVGLSGGMWASTSGLRSDVRDILTRMASEQRVADANAKLLEVNNTTISRALEANSKEMKESLGAVTRRQELQQYEIQQLKETIMKLAARGETR